MGYTLLHKSIKNLKCKLNFESNISKTKDYKEESFEKDNKELDFYNVLQFRSQLLQIAQASTRLHTLTRKKKLIDVF